MQICGHALFSGVSVEIWPGLKHPSPWSGSASATLPYAGVLVSLQDYLMMIILELFLYRFSLLSGGCEPANIYARGLRNETHETSSLPEKIRLLANRKDSEKPSVVHQPHERTSGEDEHSTEREEQPNRGEEGDEHEMVRSRGRKPGTPERLHRNSQWGEFRSDLQVTYSLLLQHIGLCPR